MGTDAPEKPWNPQKRWPSAVPVIGCKSGDISSRIFKSYMKWTCQLKAAIIKKGPTDQTRHREFEIYGFTCSLSEAQRMLVTEVGSLVTRPFGRFV